MNQIAETTSVVAATADPVAPPFPAEVPTRSVLVACALLATSFALCLFAYLAFAVVGPWFTSVRAVHWTPEAMVVSRGSGQQHPEGLTLTAPDASGATVVSLTTSLRSSQYPVIAWQSLGVPDDIEVALLWKNDYEPARVFIQRLAVEAGRIQPFSFAGDRNWNGTITGIALGFKGSYQQPILVLGATAKTMSAGEVLADRMREWFTFEAWNGSSINTIIGGADVQNLPMPFAFAVMVGLAALLYTALARWRPDWVGRSTAFVIGGMFVAAWFLVDTRMQWNLFRQASVTARQYAGLSWSERHLAAEDKMVFAFIEKVRTKLPPPPTRVFMVGDEPYFRDRGAYHLYPYNVFFDPFANTMPPPSAFHSGDYLVAFQRQGLQYDPAQRSLRWDAGPPVAAELVFAEGAAAMFKIL
jgi:hypothetical protein